MSYSTTLRKLRDNDACEYRYNYLVSQLGLDYVDDTEIPLATILNANGVMDALWALCACDLSDAEEKQIRSLACDYAEHVLHVFERRYPDDKRPRECIVTTRKWIKGEAIDFDLISSRTAGLAVAKAILAFDTVVVNNDHDAAYAAVAAIREDYAVEYVSAAAIAAVFASLGLIYDVARTAHAASAFADTERAWQAQKLREVIR